LGELSGRKEQRWEEKGVGEGEKRKGVCRRRVVGDERWEERWKREEKKV